MINKLTKILLVKLKDDIEEENREIVEYGIHQMISVSFNIATVVVISLLYGLFWEGVALLLLFWPLRIYAGGFHAKTEMKCYLLSTVAVTVILGAVYYTSHDNNFMQLPIALLAMFIYMLSPQDNSVKRLDTEENKKYKRIVLAILIGEMILVFIVSGVFYNKILVVFLYSLVLMSILLVWEYIQRVFKENQNLENKGT